MSLITKKINIGGMTCVNCQNKIEKKLQGTAGIQEAKVSYNTGTAVVTYDSNTVSLGELVSIIEKLDYVVLTGNERQVNNASRIIGLLFIIASLYIFLEHFGLLNLLTPSQLAEANMGYGMIFVIGLVTSVHCIAMCGGINLSQCLPKGEQSGAESRLSVFIPSFLYNLGRVVSYTAVGFAVGALGSAIDFSTAAQGVLKLIAGIFMIIMGMNMLDIFPWLRKFNPRMPKFIAQRVNKEKARNNSPLIVGLLNGFMPCGPLQAMQIYALSTGSPITGAISMFLFSVGTVPLMFGLGAISSALGKKFTKKVMAVGAVLVVVLGLSMFTQGMNLSGISFGAVPGTPSASTDGGGINVENGVQVINSTLTSNKYPAITVQAGIPVRWIIDAPQGTINGCNDRFFINEYGIEHKFTYGENIIEFTPTKTGTFKYSCWMGMITSTITVVEAGTVGENAADNAVTPNPIPANVAIPTENLAIAKLASENGSEYQTVTIELTDSGYSPAVVVAQFSVDIRLIINNTSTKDENSTMLIPAYATALDLIYGENPLSLVPMGSFEFSTGDNKFYGYVKVVDNLGTLDQNAIKEEVANFQTLIWPAHIFLTDSANSGSCCD